MWRGKTRTLDRMSQRPYVLTDFEDRALAACDDMYLETTIARNVLSTWYERVIPFRELRPAYQRLVDLAHPDDVQPIARFLSYTLSAS